MSNCLKIISMALLLIFISLTPSVQAAEVPSEKTVENSTEKTVLMVLYDKNKNSNSAEKNNRKIIVNPIKEKLTPNKFNVIDDALYYERLQKTGSDVAGIERNDILDLYKDIPSDYILLIELRPSNFGSEISTSAHVKLLDVKEQKYLYNSSIYKSTVWGSVYATIRKIAEELGLIIDAKLISKPH